jgi:hypothetical protein
MAAILAGLRSQEKFCAHMRQPLLEELVRRVTMLPDNINIRRHKPSAFRNDYLQFIKELSGSQLTTGLFINTAFKKSENYSDPADYYIVIEFIRHKVKLGHITFHLVYDNCQRINTNSIFHVKNNQSKRRGRRLYIKEDSELANCIAIYLGDIITRPHNIGNELYELSEYAVDVMNFYIQSPQQHPWSLENRRADNVQLDDQTQAYITDIIKLNARCFRGGMLRQRSSTRRSRKFRKTTIRTRVR